MAAMFITKNLVFNLSKSFPQTSSLSLRKSRKVSRVCFSSASNYNYDEDRDPVDKARDSRADMAYRSKETINETDEDVSHITDRAKETMKEGIDRTKERAQEMKEKAKDSGHGTDRAAETAQSTKEKAKEYAHSMKDKTAEAVETVSEKTKEDTYKAAETAQSLGEKAKQTVKGAWDVAKDTTQKIKETVLGKDEDDRERRMDEDVVETRRQVGERDNEKHH